MGWSKPSVSGGGGCERSLGLGVWGKLRAERGIDWGGGGEMGGGSAVQLPEPRPETKPPHRAGRRRERERRAFKTKTWESVCVWVRPVWGPEDARGHKYIADIYIGTVCGLHRAPTLLELPPPHLPHPPASGGAAPLPRRDVNLSESVRTEKIKVSK